MNWVSKRIIALVALVLVAMFISVFYNQDVNPRYFPAENSSELDEYDIVAFGDSIIEGLGARPGEDFVSILSDKLDIEILNKGVRGDTTTEALARLESDVLQYEPELVILLLGGNDVIKFISRETTFENLDMIVDIIQNSGAEVLLIGVRTGTFSDPYREEFLQFAQQRNLLFVPNILEDILFNPRNLFDPVHPNSRGHELIADRVEPSLRLLLER